MNKKINYTFEQVGNVGIYNLTGELTTDHEDDLKLILMRAIHSIDRAVFNLKKVTSIDLKCLKLLKKAYCTSLRLKSPIILTEVPHHYISEIYNCVVADKPHAKESPHFYEGIS
jgi:anti-anti-sigma regulatory factor